MIDAMTLPKAELHVHIEGTFEPELMFGIAERNRIKLDYPDVAALRAAYNFTDLQSFLKVYYQGIALLRAEQDYYDLTAAYLRKARSQGVRHAEIFFDAQTHTNRGVTFRAVIDGMWAALVDGKRDLGITSHLIMCFRDLDAQSAMQTFESALAFQDRIVAVGLDADEVGNPSSTFQAVFDRARAQGFFTVAHAGQEGTPEYVWQVLDALKVSRIDHGIRSMEDPLLVDRLRRDRVPITVCPVSNARLHMVPSLAAHPLKKMLDAGLAVSCNSDDPGYFGAYIADNYQQAAAALALTDDDLVTLARNSFVASFIDDPTRQRYLAELTAIRSS
ncbi:MAG: adenosine deaminase [Candidatus Cybelea sp.]